MSTAAHPPQDDLSRLHLVVIDDFQGGRDVYSRPPSQRSPISSHLQSIISAE